MMADNIDGKILSAYIDGIIDGREMRRQEWLEWLEYILPKDMISKITIIENKIKELKKELEK